MRLWYGVLLVAIGAVHGWGCFTYDLEERKAPESNGSQSWSEAVGELVLPLISEHDTKYASGFSEDKFQSVRIGSTESEVASALGNPLLKKKFPDGTVCWYYSRPGRHNSYFVRVLEFGDDRKLEQRRSYFYLD